MIIGAAPCEGALVAVGFMFFFLVHCSLVHDFSIFSDSFRLIYIFVMLQKCMMLE